MIGKGSDCCCAAHHPSVHCTFSECTPGWTPCFADHSRRTPVAPSDNHSPHNGQHAKKSLIPTHVDHSTSGTICFYRTVPSRFLSWRPSYLHRPLRSANTPARDHARHVHYRCAPTALRVIDLLHPLPCQVNSHQRRALATPGARPNYPHRYHAPTIAMYRYHTRSSPSSTLIYCAQLPPSSIASSGQFL